MINNFLSKFVVLVTVFVISVSCSGPDYSRLPEKNNDINELLKHIVPNKLVEYWQVENVSVNEKPYDLMFSKGNKGNRVLEDTQGVYLLEGFFKGCQPSYCAYRIRYLQSGKWKVADSEELLKQFIGHVDNEYEAFLISKISRFSIDSSGKGNGFIKTESGYMLKVMKYKICPESKESFTMFVTASGEIKNIKSEGFYLKTKDCKVY